jgi:hypothetical protein
VGGFVGYRSVGMVKEEAGGMSLERVQDDHPCYPA